MFFDCKCDISKRDKLIKEYIKIEIELKVPIEMQHTQNKASSKVGQGLRSRPITVHFLIHF